MSATKTTALKVSERFESLDNTSPVPEPKTVVDTLAMIQAESAEELRPL
jgi:hypothetical protein